MVNYKISIIDSNEHLYVIKIEAKSIEDAETKITQSRLFIDVGNNKKLNPEHIVTLKVEKYDA